MVDEWPTTARGKAHPATQRAFDEPWQAVYTIAPRAAGESNWHAEMVRRTNGLSDLRQACLFSSGAAIPAVLWAALIAGAVLVVAYSYVYWMPRFHAHALLRSALAARLALGVLVILSLDHPFTGHAGIERDLLDQQRRRMGPQMAP